MNKSFDPWSEIGPSKDVDDLNVRRADPDHPLDFWFGRDFQGRYIFYLDANIAASSVKSMPRFSGVELNLVSSGETTCRLVLTLSDKELLDLFGALCADLMSGTTDLQRKEPGGLQIVILRLKRWQELFEKARDNVLSQSRIIGLIGELLFLRDFILPGISAHDAILSWRGPYGDEQDFLLEGRIIETKTQLSTSDQYLNISSENQLDISSGPIMICHQTVYVPSSEEAGGVSLNDLVVELKDLISHSDVGALHLFDSGLIESGYLKREEYDRPLWLLNGRSYFEVRDEFPRISPADISDGIDRVRYRISITACKGFELIEEVAKEWAFNG